jgi:hypothetical protein
MMADQMTKEQKANYDAAQRLADVEHETNVAVLALVTAFLADLQATADKLTFPPSYTSPARNLIGELAGSLTYRRDVDLPSRIAAYQQASGGDAAPPAIA